MLAYADVRMLAYAGVCWHMQVILLIGGAILSDGTNFHTDESGERIDPYKVLGLPTSATGKLCARMLTYADVC